MTGHRLTYHKTPSCFHNIWTSFFGCLLKMWFLTEKKKIPLKATLTFAASLKSAPHCARPNWIDCAFPWNWANLFDGPGVASTSVAGSPSNARPSNDNQFPHFIFFFSSRRGSIHHWNVLSSLGRWPHSCLFFTLELAVGEKSGATDVRHFTFNNSASLFENLSWNFGPSHGYPLDIRKMSRDHLMFHDVT